MHSLYIYISSTSTVKNVQTSPQNRRNFEKKFDAISGSVDKWPGGKLTRDSFVYSQVLSKVTSQGHLDFGLTSWYIYQSQLWKATVRTTGSTTSNDSETLNYSLNYSDLRCSFYEFQTKNVYFCIQIPCYVMLWSCTKIMILREKRRVKLPKGWYDRVDWIDIQSGLLDAQL